jgi:hypothetical protein
MRSDVTVARTQAERQHQARRLLRQAAGRLEVASGGSLRVTDPALAREFAALKAEVRELLAGLRCVRCGEPLGAQARVPAEVGFTHKWTCAGPARRPRVSGR